MPTDVTLSPALVDQVLRLSAADQDQLIDLILEARDGPPSDPQAVAAAWKAELGRRIEASLRGDTKAVSAKEAVARARAELLAEFGHEG